MWVRGRRPTSKTRRRSTRLKKLFRTRRRNPQRACTELMRTPLVLGDRVGHPPGVLLHRGARRAKTDRLDAEGMLRVLAAYLRGDHQACSMVRVPTPEEGDAKPPRREREKLVQERQRIENG